MAITNNTQKEIKALQNAIKALKANYPVAGSKVKFYHQESQDFQFTGVPGPRIKFTPYYGGAKNHLITLRAKILVSGNQSGFEPFINEPQDGSGAVVVRVQFEQYSASTQYTVKIYADGTSPGSFSVV